MESVLAPDGTRIAYERTGDGPPLVLVHGTLDDHHLWSPLMPALGDHFTVYAIDRRGRGGSGATDTATYAIEREFEDVAAVVDASGEPAYLLGHSYGAICALEAALLTTSVQKLVLYEPPLPIPPSSVIVSPEALEELEALLVAGNREAVVLIFLREIVQVPEEAVAALRASPQWEAVIALADTVVYEARAVKDFVFDRERFRDLTIPALLLMGSESPQFLKTATEAVDAALPRSRLVTLPGQGHLAMITAPDLFLAEVVSFLNEDPDAVAANSGSRTGVS